MTKTKKNKDKKTEKFEILTDKLMSLHVMLSKLKLTPHLSRAKITFLRKIEKDIQEYDQKMKNLATDYAPKDKNGTPQWADGQPYSVKVDQIKDEKMKEDFKEDLIALRQELFTFEKSENERLYERLKEIFISIGDDSNVEMTNFEEALYADLCDQMEIPL